MSTTAQGRSFRFFGLLLALALGGCGNGSTLGGPNGTWGDDGGASSHQEALTADAGPDATYTLPPGQATLDVTLDASGSRATHGAIASYRWTGTPDPADVVDPTVSLSAGVWAFFLRVSDDGGGQSAPAGVTVTVLPAPNHAPLAAARVDQNAKAGAWVTLDGRASSDSDGDLITYHWEMKEKPSESAAALGDDASVATSFLADQPGTYRIALTVTDGRAPSAPDEVVVTAALTNAAPTAEAGPDQSVVTGGAVSLDGSGSYDPEGAALSYLWRFLSKPPESAAAFDDPSSPAPSFSTDRDGPYVVELTTNDGALDSLPSYVSVAAATGNAKPVAWAGNDQTVVVAATITLDGTGSSDANHDPLTYRWSVVSRPAGSAAALEDPEAPKPRFSADRGGADVFRLVVSDGRLTSDPSTVVVWVNQPPVVHAGADQEVTLPASAPLAATVTDDGLPAPAALTLAWSRQSGPGTVTFGDDRLASTWARFTVEGVYVVRLTADDGQRTSFDDLTVTVGAGSPATNQAPVARAWPDQTVVLPALASLQGSATDDGLPVGSSLGFAWSKRSGPGPVVFDTPAAASTTARFSEPGSYVVRLTVSDGALTGTADASVAVTDGSLTLAAVANRTLPLGARFQQVLQAGGGTGALTYSLEAPPPGAALAPPPLLDWTPTATQVGVHPFTAQVTDSLGHTARASFLVTVEHANQAPRLAPQPSLTAPVGTLFARTLTASDPDGGATLAFLLVSGPAGMTLTGGDLTWSTAGVPSGDYVVTVKVTDGGGLFDQKSFTLTLTQAAPPPAAVDDRYEVRVGETLVTPAAGVLANDLSYSGKPLTALKLSDPDKGTLDALRADGGFTYTAPATLPPAPGLNPVVSWRGVAERSDHFALAANVDHDGVVDYVFSDLGDFRAKRGSDGSQLWQWDRSITTHANVSACGTAWDEFALGDVTGGGDIYLFSSINCDQGGYAGYPDRLFAVNASQVLAGGKVATQWLSERLSRPHPGAYATATSSAPADPPVTPFFGASANGSVPTLAKLTAGGSTKLLTRFLADDVYGAYFDTPNSSHLGRAACRTLTGLLADEGRACKATYVIDAATGAIDQVLTAPNAANQWHTYNNTPTVQNIPIVADLDGDGQVEIISGGDVWKLISGVWTLAWQAEFASVTPGVKLGFEPTSVAVADLDGDGKAEVIIHIIGYDNGPEKNAGGIHIFNHDGTLRRTIPIVFTWINGLLSVADVDGDGAPEILLAGDSFVYAYRQDGTLLWAKLLPDITSDIVLPIGPIGNTPRTTDSPLYVYDLDLDGVPEVIVQGTRRLFILNGRTGAELWSIDTESDGYYKHGNPLLVDADDDGHVDILVHLADLWNCGFWGSGPGGCRGNAMRISGGNHNWAPGPKVQNQLNFRPGAGDTAAKVLYDPSVRRDFRQPAQQGTAVDARVAQSTSFSHKANDGAADSPPATVFVDLKPPNRPPVITSTPPTALFRVSPDGVKTIYTLTALDPDPGDTVQYELVSSNFDTTYFPGPTVDRVTGAVELYSCLACGSARVVFNVAAVDSQGARAEQSFLVDLSHTAVAVADVTGQPLPAARTALEAAGLTARVVAELFATQPAGTVLGQDPTAGTADVARSATVRLTVSKGPRPVLLPFVVGRRLAEVNALLTGTGLTVHVTPVFSTTIPAGEILGQAPAAGLELLPASAPPVSLTVSAGPPLAAPVASLVLEPGPGAQLRTEGDALQYTAVALLTDGTSADVTLSAAWASTTPGVATIDTAGVAGAVAAGAATLSATLDGKTGHATFNVAARALGDNTPPTAAITAPADGGSVTEPTPLVGTASDAHFLRYEVAVAPAGDENYTLIAEGTTAVTNGTLATLDPTTRVNDLYTVRLTVFDRAGNQSVATRTVQVVGRRKVGAFTLTFQDLNLPASGIPLTVQRTYDSRDKETGDFGVGWRLGLQTLRLRTNRVLGTGWVRTVTGPTVSLAPTSEHKVSLTLPDGRVEEFDLQVSPTSNFGSLDFTHVTGFQPRPGTLGRLQALANPALLIVNGGAEDELVDDGTLNTYAPLLYRYTTADGTLIEVSPTAGVKKVTDPNGNTVTFGPGGILHSNGTGIVFTRDTKDRIVAITEPQGTVHTYAYDGNGDLVVHTNPVGGVSRFAYDRTHGLSDVRDAAGNHAVRNEYDDAGRLTATIDGFGRRVEFTHNVDTRQELVRDRLGYVTLFEYDAGGDVVAKTDALGGRTTYTHDSRGNELSVTDPLGRVASKTYDDGDNVLTRTDFDGHTTTTTYNARHQVLTTLDPEGRTTTNVYDANGNLTGTTDPEGGVTRHTYSAEGNRVTTTDPLGGVTTFGYDGSGRKTSETDPRGTVTTLTYDAAGTLVSSSKGGRTLQFQRDGVQRLTQTTDARGNQGSMTYSDVGDGQKIASATHSNGGVTQFHYDVVGNEVGTTFPDGSTQAKSYDVENRLLSQTDRDGATTTFQYDAVGRQTKTTHPDGTTIVQSYDGAGRLASQTDERGNTTTYGYAARRQTVTDALGNVTVHEFDSSRRRIKTTDALGRSTTFGYHSTGLLTATTFPDGTTTTTTYDRAGQKIAETDQAGGSLHFTYDGVGNLLDVTNGAGEVTHYAYDAVGNRMTETDANGRTTQRDYHADGRLARRTRPLGQQEAFTVNASGRPLLHSDFNGKLTTFAYDGADRLTAKTLPDGRVVHYAYTNEGLRTQAGGDSYHYDGRGRLTQETKASGEVVSYTYDGAGNKTSLTTPQGTTRFTYDALNRLATLADATGTTTYTYDGVGNLTGTALPNGLATTYTYDALNRLTQVTHRGPGGLLSSYTYTLGTAGNRLRVVEAGPATTGRTVSYTYDAVYRLTQETIDAPGTANAQVIAYRYDGVGNRVEMHRAGAVTTYAYDANDRLRTETTGAETFTSTYDDNGNLTGRSDGTRTDSYTYDDENRLVSARVETGTHPGWVSYTYDDDGLRLSETAAGGTTTFLLDKNGKYAQVVVEATGSTVATYSYGNQLLSQTRTGDGTHFYLSDGQLSTRQLTTPTGLVSDTYTYDAFGVTTASTGTTQNVYRYTGERLDANVGFYYLRARYYQQATGRFVTTDPREGNVFDPASLHRYLYAHGNPVNFSDPSGEAESAIELLAGLVIRGSLMGGVVGVTAKTIETLFVYGRLPTPRELGTALAQGLLGGAEAALLAYFEVGALSVAVINISQGLIALHLAKKDVYWQDVIDLTVTAVVVGGVFKAAGGEVAGKLATTKNEVVDKLSSYMINLVMFSFSKGKLTDVQKALGTRPKQELFWRAKDPLPQWMLL